MAGSINKAILIGNVGDIQIFNTKTGHTAVTLSVATSETWQDRASGEQRKKTEWHRVVIFDEQLVTVAQEYLKVGCKVYVEGQIQTRKWKDKDGSEHDREIVLSEHRSKFIILNHPWRRP